jgi:hypothetical protein
MMNMAEVTAIRELTDEEALASLRERGKTTMAAAALARQWGWNERKAQRKLDDWETDGLIRRRGKQITVLGTALIRKPDMSDLVRTDIRSDMSAMSLPVKTDTKSDIESDTRNDMSASQPGRSVAVRNAARDAATVAAPGSDYVARLLMLEPAPAANAVTRLMEPRIEVLPPPTRHRFWTALGRAGVGLAIVCTGAFIAYTSLRANAWFGHSLTPDPVAGEVYSNLSVAAEIIACLIPTAIRFYWQNGEPWTALRGWALMAVALVVVFFAAGGFAVTNINSGVEARAERETLAMRDLRTQIASLDKSIIGECSKRGDRCRDLERQRAEANAKLAIERVSLKADADPQAAALGVSSTSLHLVQAGAMVALCLFSGLFISFGAGLIWPR